MIEIILLIIFAASLLLCTFFGQSMFIALILGFIMFYMYGLRATQDPVAVAHMALKGIKTASNVLITFIFIGIMTGIWRCCGTIAYIVYYSVSICTPHFILPASFLLCSLISTLTGTAFGSAATMGVICMTIANSMGISPWLSGGAILAGVFVGDRCSPMSTSALLVSSLTLTNIFDNVKIMFRRSIVPFAAACILYLITGFTMTVSDANSRITDIFAENYNLSPVTVIPAVIIIILSLFKIEVKITMAISAAAGAVIAVLVQAMEPLDTLKVMVLGFHPSDPELGALMEGGGIISMVKVFCIVCIATSFAGIFKGTGFLNNIQAKMQALARKITNFGAYIAAGTSMSFIGCNQTLAIMLTDQICEGILDDKTESAMALEDTAVVISALIPCSIASAVPLTTVGAPLLSIIFAFYLYLVPLWHLITNPHCRRPAEKIKQKP